MSRRVIVCLIGILLSSCAVKHTQKLDLPSDNEKKITESGLFKNRIPEWTTCKGQISLELEKNQKTSLQSLVTIKKDSLIWASVKAAFGIELFRLMVTNDSIYYIDRVKKTFFIKPISDASEISEDIDFLNLQAILTGTINSKETTENFITDFSFFSNNITYFIDSTKQRVTSMNYIKDEKNIELKYNYSKKLGKGIIPSQIEILGFKNKSAIIKHTKIIFNQKQNISFKIPNSYAEKL